jgi:molybdopterin molybdotransferase
VLKREESTVEEGRLHGSAIEPATYVRKRGVSVSEGEKLFQAGERLSPKDALLLAELGYDAVRVREPFRVGVLATGTEFVEGRATDLDSPMLVGLLRSWGHEATYEGAVADDLTEVTDAIERLATDYDVVVTTGGTSVGHKDYVIRALDDLGTVDFHRVRIRPGKPIAMAALPDQNAVAFAIPGKPIGAHTISTFVMGPFFTGESDLPTVDAELARTVDTGPDGFEYMVPVTVNMADSEREAMPLGHVDSPLSIYERTFDPSVISSHTRSSRADGVVATRSRLEAGETVSVIPYSVLE